MLLLLALVARTIFACPLSRAGMTLTSSVLVTGVLSHEVFAFLALPASAFLLYLSLRIYPFKNSLYSHPQLKSFRPGQLLRPLLILAPPAFAFVAVLIHRGSLQQVREISSSWSSTLPPILQSKNLGGSIGWLGVSMERATETTHQLLGTNYYGIPYWLIVFLASIAGVILIGLAISDLDDRGLFIGFAMLQFTMMVPVFQNSLDQGRWIVLCLCSSFILMMESSHAMRGVEPKPFHFPSTGIPQLFQHLWPVGLGLWGIPHFGWSLQGWLWSSPFTSLVMKPYFYMRTYGIPGPKQLLDGFVN